MAAMLADNELKITRTFDAPPELVFELWSTPNHLRNWMGPEGYECPVAEIDFRVGGRYRALIRSSETGDSWFSGVYREIEPSKRLVFTFAWDNTGPSAGVETLVTIDFAEVRGKTTMTFHQTPFRDVEARDRHIGGWTSAFAKAAAYAQRLSNKERAT
jgi:uncharacterized protein YndB with AHSA1/START domain